ncbi:hypothetical protein GCK72_013974 [Caenorhabditis remanei]|uniref:Uncharacterized protein n=1 Tax=Caenorhabditis remanei TaxID=31234 RepID=A0A6A5GPZ0_CAERE|nr:hypothetical protein GCK72_013974 [Caenorhabditis remanei]KAF1757518.1 hypothetical protein GCK72_013974 [Caenorhabditis remanei]
MLSPPAAVKYVSFSWAVFYVLAVLFGAPFFSDFIATAVLAATLTLVSAAPAVLLFDSEEQLLELLVSSFSCENIKTNKESIYLSTSTFAVLGAWAAAAVHPLDWDRWWQRYPLPSLIGCVCGALLGLLVGIVRVYIGKRISHNKAKKRPFATGDSSGGRFGHYTFDDAPKLLGILLAEFDNTEGPIIKHSVPRGNINVEATFSFTKDHTSYERGRFTFDMALIVDMTSSAETMYEPIVQKCAEYLIELEMEYNFLTNSKYQKQVLEMMEKMFIELSSKGESVIEITLEDDKIVSLYFKLCPLYRGCEPPEIDYHMVPMFIREVDLTDRLIEKMDVLSQKIIPQIDGINTVREIAISLELDPSLVARCVRNLHFYECVSLVPMFLYYNTYVATERVHDFYKNQKEINECLDFVKIQSITTEDGSEIPMPTPEFSDVFRLYLSMKVCGKNIGDWTDIENPRSMGIDEHRLVQFGMHHQFLRKLSVYPICTVNPGNNSILKACNGKTSLDELSLRHNVEPRTMFEILSETEKFEFVMK